MLGDKPFLMRDSPTGIDATTLAEPAAILTPFSGSGLRQRAAGYPNLVTYTARLMAHYYPDHPWMAETSLDEDTPNAETDRMTRVLFVGQKPETVDFSDPAIPPGFNAEKIHAGIAIALSKMVDRGWQADPCMIPPDEAGRLMLEKQLATTAYDCVVVGAGIRLPPKSLPFFETVINTVHKAAPNASIAFNTRPEDTADAAARWL